MLLGPQPRLGETLVHEPPPKSSYCELVNHGTEFVPFLEDPVELRTIVYHEEGLMAKQKRKFGVGRRMLNAVVRPMAEHGWGPSFWYVLSVRGRKSGLERSTPLAVVELGGRRWLVAGYGVVDWVWNVRVADEVTLTRGGRAETFHPTEVGASEAVPVLREYLRRVRVARPYFDAAVHSPDEDFAVDASRHPVFRLDAPPEGPAR
jgi:hypothetical protein